MQQTQETPLHWDEPRTKLNLTIIFALIVVLIAVIEWNPYLFVLGLGVVIYSWLTNAKQYQIFQDRLVIIYGLPRVKAYPFQEIAHSELLSLPIGDRLRIRMVNGRRMMLLTKDTETFRAKLDEALEAFHSGQRGADYGKETQSGQRSEIESGTEPEVEPEIETEIPPETRMGESSTENDNVPY